MSYNYPIWSLLFRSLTLLVRGGADSAPPLTNRVNDKDMDLILLIVVPDTDPNMLAETEMHLKCNVFNGK